MRRQRSKAELLMQVKIYEAMVRDSRHEQGIRGGVQYWCTEVAWCCTLSDRERMSGKALQDFIRHMQGNDVSGLDENRRDEIRKMLKGIGVAERIESRSMDPVRGRPHRIDAVVEELHCYNASVMNDYRLLACEYLHKVRGFGAKRLRRDIAYSVILEDSGTENLQMLRKALYDKTGLWLAMCQGDDPEGDTEGKEVEYMGQEAADGTGGIVPG